jgi:hypothetical protein
MGTEEIGSNEEPSSSELYIVPLIILQIHFLPPTHTSEGRIVDTAFPAFGGN